MVIFNAILSGLAVTFVEMLGIVFLDLSPAQMGRVTLLLCFVNILLALLLTKGYFRYRVTPLSSKRHDPLDPTLMIAKETLPYMRLGLNEATAQKAAEIIFRISDVSAVAITDTENVLAYLGAGCDRHHAGKPIATQATRDALISGEVTVVENKEHLRCPNKDKGCPLQSAVIAPLVCRGKVVGTVKLYNTKKGKIPAEVIKLSMGIAQLLAVQVELAELDRQSQLLTKAELQALHAQINPHFFFNTLNTIIMFSRTEPETARHLLIMLAQFLRHSLKKHDMLNTLDEEMEYVNTYLVLEKARFREKFSVDIQIAQELLQYKIPVLAIQPLVENAIKHGITPMIGKGKVSISAKQTGRDLLIMVSDDGVGIPPDQLPHVMEPGFGSGNGVGLNNVNERLKSMFGEAYGLQIVTVVDQGTQISFRVPLGSGISAEEDMHEQIKGPYRG